MIKFMLIVHFFILGLAFSVNAQDSLTAPLDKRLQKVWDEGKKLAAKGDLEKSNRKFEEVLKTRPDFTEAYLRMGTNLHQLKQSEKAESLFLKAIELQPDYTPEMYFSLAVVQADLGKHEKAANNYEIFIKMADPEKTRLEKIKQARSRRDNLKFIAKALQQPVPFEPATLGAGINTFHGEYSPWLAADGKKIIFTRNVKAQSDFIGQEDFYEAAFDGTQWGMAKPVEALNTSQNEGAFSVSANGKFMVFTACDRKDSYGSCDLYYAVLQQNKWSIPVNMGHIVNSSAWDSHPSLNADGSLLIFASRRNGSVGGSDLWMTWRDDKNSWIKPMNAGMTLNSTGNDESPFLHPDGQTLYFRSDGWPGMGNFDLFYSKYDVLGGQWQPPVNLGHPINTEGSEGSLAVAADGETAYYATDTDFATGTRKSDLDLFSFTLPELSRSAPFTYVVGNTVDARSGNSLAAEITIVDLEGSGTAHIYKSDEQGSFTGILVSGRQYACMAKAKGYNHYSVHFDLKKATWPFDPYTLRILLEPLPDSSATVFSNPVILENIFFETGSDQLTPASQYEIERLFSLLREDNQMTIHIIGHTDNIGKASDNLILSQNRAKSVANALIQRGITPTRITTEGKGENEPIATNDTEEGQRKNRRTTFTLSRKGKK
jgi:outer membrane protein OmpA-like peptidoglycan-associated protein/tetratricopeptide (TPR) repeat protein